MLREHSRPSSGARKLFPSRSTADPLAQGSVDPVVPEGWVQGKHRLSCHREEAGCQREILPPPWRKDTSRRSTYPHRITPGRWLRPSGGQRRRHEADVILVQIPGTNKWGNRSDTRLTGPTSPFGRPSAASDSILSWPDAR